MEPVTGSPSLGLPWSILIPAWRCATAPIFVACSRRMKMLATKTLVGLMLSIPPHNVCHAFIFFARDTKSSHLQHRQSSSLCMKLKVSWSSHMTLIWSFNRGEPMARLITVKPRKANISSTSRSILCHGL